MVRAHGDHSHHTKASCGRASSHRVTADSSDSFTISPKSWCSRNCRLARLLSSPVIFFVDVLSPPPRLSLSPPLLALPPPVTVVLAGTARSGRNSGWLFSVSRQVAALCQWVLRVDIEQAQKTGLRQGAGYLEVTDPEVKR